MLVKVGKAWLNVSSITGLEIYLGAVIAKTSDGLQFECGAEENLDTYAGLINGAANTYGNPEDAIQP